MGMPAFYITALTSLILVFAEFQDWSMLAIMGVLFLAGTGIAYSAKKYSYWATLSLIVGLVIIDAISRNMGGTPTELHTNVSVADLGYTGFLVASVGWIGGWMMRGRESDPQKVPMLTQEPELVRSRSPFAAPVRRRRTA
jgi:hypothetical protein